MLEPRKYFAPLRTNPFSGEETYVTDELYGSMGAANVRAREIKEYTDDEPLVLVELEIREVSRVKVTRTKFGKLTYEKI